MTRKTKDADTEKDGKGKARVTRRILKPDEEILWSKVSQSIRPLAKEKTRPASGKQSDPQNRVRQKDATQESACPRGQAAKTALVMPSPAAKRGRRSSLPSQPASTLEPSLKRKLTRGRRAIEARLDLHGLTQAKAKSALGRFIAEARKKDFRTVLVITGKGREREGSPPQGVLRAALPGWLGELSDSVVAFEVAAAPHGGGGAYYLQLRARQK